jgi:hypothetical protein
MHGDELPLSTAPKYSLSTKKKGSEHQSSVLSCCSEHVLTEKVIMSPPCTELYYYIDGQKGDFISIEAICCYSLR